MATAAGRDPPSRCDARPGSGSNEARVFDTNHSNALIGTVAGLSRGVFSLDFNPFGTAMAIAGSWRAARFVCPASP